MFPKGQQIYYYYFLGLEEGVELGQAKLVENILVKNQMTSDNTTTSKMI